jgi:hypothetical protein
MSMPSPAFAAMGSVWGLVQATRIRATRSSALRGRGRIVVSGMW